MDHDQEKTRTVASGAARRRETAERCRKLAADYDDPEISPTWRRLADALDALEFPD